MQIYGVLVAVDDDDDDDNDDDNDDDHDYDDNGGDTGKTELLKLTCLISIVFLRTMKSSLITIDSVCLQTASNDACVRYTCTAVQLCS